MHYPNAIWSQYPLPPTVIVAGEPKYKVKEILDSRKRGKGGTLAYNGLPHLAFNSWEREGREPLMMFFCYSNHHLADAVPDKGEKIPLRLLPFHPCEETLDFKDTIQKRESNVEPPMEEEGFRVEGRQCRRWSGWAKGGGQPHHQSQITSGPQNI